MSYPSRGVGGNSKYHGNWSPNFVEGLLATHYRGGLVVDPMEGSGTTRAVCAKHRIPYAGFDLSSGFDITSDELRPLLPRRPSLVLMHPPYHDMVRYSGTEWGTAPHARDLSRAADYETFLLLLALSMRNVHRALHVGGRYVVVTADRRRKGDLYTIGADLLPFAPGKKIASIIKIQHKVRSAAHFFGPNFVRIAHEQGWVLEKVA